MEQYNNLKIEINKNKTGVWVYPQVKDMICDNEDANHVINSEIFFFDFSSFKKAIKTNGSLMHEGNDKPFNNSLVFSVRPKTTETDWLKNEFSIN